MVAKMLPEGETVIVSGKVEWFNGRASMVHPDYIASLEDAANLPMVEPVYPLTAGLSPKTLARAVKEALSRVPTMPEWVDAPCWRGSALPVSSNRSIRFICRKTLRYWA